MAVATFGVQMTRVADSLALSRVRLGAILGASPSTVGRWLRGAATPRPDNVRRLHELAAVSERLALVMKPDTAASWLQTPNSLLQGASPAERIASGGYRDVLGVIEALGEGVFVQVPLGADILRRVSEQLATEWSGEAFRHTAPQFNPLSAQGSRATGGRWNPPGLFGAIYLADSQETCLAEFRRMALGQGGASGYLPRAFYRIAVERLSVLDLSSVDQLAVVGLTLDDLAREDWSLCQAVAEAAHFSGFEGIMAPSAAGSGLVIAAFDDRAEHRLRVLGHEIIDTA